MSGTLDSLAATPSPERAIRRFAVAALGVTFALGLSLRSAAVWPTFTALGLDFANVRHAHSHVGFFGALTAGWWLLELELGVPVPRWGVWAYAAAVGAVTALFVPLGYRVPTIALSTLVAGLWLWVGVQHLRARRGHAPSWLDVVPFGLASGALLIPLIAVLAKRDFALSREVAHAFIAAVLFTVFVPAAFARLGLVRRTPVLVWGVLALGAAARGVFTERAGALGGLLACCFAALVGLEVGRAALSPRWKLVWLSLPGAVLAGGFVPWAQAAHVRLAGLHFLVLGVVVPALFRGWDGVPAPARWAYAVSLSGMTVSAVWPRALCPAAPGACTLGASLVFVVAAIAALGPALARAVSFVRARPGADSGSMLPGRP